MLTPVVAQHASAAVSNPASGNGFAARSVATTPIPATAIHPKPANNSRSEPRVNRSALPYSQWCWAEIQSIHAALCKAISAVVRSSVSPARQ